MGGLTLVCIVSIFGVQICPNLVGVHDDIESINATLGIK
jgi:hypothetical protein